MKYSKGPDGTRGFTFGRGKPVQKQASSSTDLKALLGIPLSHQHSQDQVSFPKPTPPQPFAMYPPHPHYYMYPSMAYPTTSLPVAFPPVMMASDLESILLNRVS
jgi:hypothetical protein